MRAKLEVEQRLRAGIAGLMPRERDVDLDAPTQVDALINALGTAAAKDGDARRVVEDLEAYPAAAKRAVDFDIMYTRHLNPTTGRIHSRYRQLGTATGRMTSRDTCLHNVPRRAAHRRCFRPANGRVLVKADLSQVELCVAADITGDERMTLALDDGQDLHRLTAAALFDKCVEDVDDRERGFGKRVNFGTLYGQGRAGLVQEARSIGLHINDDEAEIFQERFASAWPQLASWRRQQLRDRSETVRTASGRVRRVAPDARGTIRVNTPIQGTAADGFKAALALLWETRDRHSSAVPVLAVHDELVVECDAEQGEAVAAWLEGCLVSGMECYVKRAPIRVTVRIGTSWADET